MKDILQKLVSFQTTADNYEANDRGLDYIANFLSERGMTVKQYDIKGKQSLVASTQRSNHQKPTVMLAAHLDVVSAPDDLFKLREKDGKFYGRGVFDMKFAIAAYMKVVDDLNGQLQNYDFGIMVTTDEEIGGFNGAKTLIDKGYRPKVVILPDAGDSPHGWKIERSAKSICYLEVKTHGKNAHGAKPWKGENAIEKLVDILGEVRPLFKNPGAKTSTLNIGTIRGGVSTNQVPDEASVTLDIRTVTDEESEKIHKQITKICKKYGAKVNSLLPRGSACHTDTNDPFVAKFMDCFKTITKGEKLTWEDSTGASDARHFAAVKIPCIVISPPGDGYHSSDEWVSENGVKELIKIIHCYLEHAVHDQK